MSTQILATKLYKPVLRPDSVLRPRLIERFNVGLHGKLTLVSAPAGCGKTTLITEWISANELQVAWLSLDEVDSDPIRFLNYIVAALQTIKPEIGKDILNLLESPQPPPIASLLTPLLNELAAIPYEFVLVLDDYHVLDSHEIDKSLAFLIDNQPPQMHLVITTREDPRLPLARLRARGQLSEIRAADLRFTTDEASEFLNTAMGLSLAPDDVAALEQRTEGWIAGLQLAAISMQGQDDVGGFIQSFTGSHHFVLDYLIEEVLSQQPTQIRDFLLKTSILERLCGSLCAAILQDDEDALATLEHIRQANLFLIPLDNERRWYRYHHLFGDLLRKRMGESTSIKINDLHIRASHWFEQHDQPSEAIHHALIAQDFERAAGMIEQVWATLHSNTFQSRELHTWMQSLPDSVYRNRPVLSAGYGWALLNFGNPHAADERLRDAERWLSRPNATDSPELEMIIADQEAFQRLPAIIASARTYYSLALGDVPNTIKYGEQVLTLAEEDDHHRRGIATSMLGLAHWYTGNLEAAYQFMSDGMNLMYKMDNIHFALSSTFGLADVRLGQGRLLDAIAIYQKGIQVAESQPYLVQGIADLYLGLGDLYREQNNLVTAQAYLDKSEALGEQAGLPIWRTRFCKVQARMEQISGDFDTAVKFLDEAESLNYVTPLPNSQPIPALRAHIWIKQGQLNRASIWAQDRGLTLDSDVTYLNEYELMTLARLHIVLIENGDAANTIHALTNLLERLLDAAKTDKRMGSVIEISVLQARLHWSLGNREDALNGLQKALQLAEPEGYIRVFVDEGLPMKAMLSEALAQNVLPSYSRKLLAAFENASSAETSHTSQPLIDPLSDRELEVLRLVADGLSNREISKRLFVALDTIKGHNRNIYQKLQVKRRTEAVARARELGLI
ncbi:MAG: LuxR C-terminal-related transcriptional regulator [Aggregatilineales bacterium]